MFGYSLISLLFLFSFLTNYAADLDDVELDLLGVDKKESKEILLNKKLSTYRSYKKKGWLYLMSHKACVSEYKGMARQCLEESLKELDQEGVRFYAPHAGDISDIFYTAIFNGYVEQSKILLRALKATESYSLDGNGKHELPCADPTGLAACMTCNDEKAGLAIAQDILDYYMPKRTECGASCWGTCNLHCQKLRKTFLAYGLSKALEKAIESKRSDDVIHFLYDRGAFVTNQAVQNASKNGVGGESVLQIHREQQMASADENNYTLLRDYKCLSAKHLEGQHGADFYRHTVVEPVLRAVIFDKKPGYASWNPFRALCAKE